MCVCEMGGAGGGGGGKWGLGAGKGERDVGTCVWFLLFR